MRSVELVPLSSGHGHFVTEPEPGIRDLCSILCRMDPGAEDSSCQLLRHSRKPFHLQQLLFGDCGVLSMWS
jgi:hypothetical protein